MSALTKYWFLEGFDLFQKLGKPTMMHMCSILEMENLDKGQVIKMNNRDNRSIFFLKQGSVKIIDSSNDIVKYIVRKGNIFGELSLYDKKRDAEECAIALEDCIICYIESDMMENLMEEHETLKNAVLKIYGIRIKRLERRLRDLLYKDSTTRITEFITSYIKEFGKEQESQLVAKNLLSHKDIANLTNTSRQTVSNTVSNLRKIGHIEYSTQYISIPKTVN
ncbi:MAG: Crp/Fnr family transcriptional regulator [Eudoraea sp.]|uniref:Crp/Fnr family transcriptional regulator n=1 Tax=Eudoraea sp. TaxID=1979955 RepID=UPI003264BFE4